MAEDAYLAGENHGLSLPEIGGPAFLDDVSIKADL